MWWSPVMLILFRTVRYTLYSELPVLSDIPPSWWWGPSFIHLFIPTPIYIEQVNSRNVYELYSDHSSNLGCNTSYADWSISWFFKSLEASTRINFERTTSNPSPGLFTSLYIVILSLYSLPNDLYSQYSMVK